MITRLTKQATSAEQLRSQAEGKLSETRQALIDQQTAWQEKETSLRQLVHQLTEERNQAVNDNRKLAKDFEVAVGRATKLEQNNATLKAEKKGLEMTVRSLEKSFRRIAPKPATD